MDPVALLNSCKTVVVYGASTNPEKPAHYVPRYMQEHGFHIIPVNPSATEIFGETCYPSLAAIPAEKLAGGWILNVFRLSVETPEIIAKALPIPQLRAVWLQEGITTTAAARAAIPGAVTLIESTCMLKAHRDQGQCQAH
ncbi:putative CoA-binding domain protein [Paratrimastix pyriformis]|uniref:CoA-binding domain protein n=1 Tax=Paratrimastix pyriformis TaxID=342808 RepID=A0ABQ8UM43_9EUKA|nr:putative CoA-binding domain protein [Paratrimastix pyriformis]